MKPVNLKVFFIVAVIGGLGLTGCGSKKQARSGSNDFASRTEAGDSSESKALLSDCNSFTKASNNLEGRVSTFYDYKAERYVNDQIRVELTNLPDEVLNGSHYLQFFRWHVTEANKTKINKQPTDIYFQYQDLQHRDGSMFINGNNPVQAISKNTIDNLLSSTDMGYSREEFLNSVSIVLGGVGLQYDAMKIALFNPDNDSKAYASTDVLLPAFPADPNKYANNESAEILQNLHPNNSLRDAGLSEEQYRSETQTHCPSSY